MAKWCGMPKISLEASRVATAPLQTHLVGAGKPFLVEGAGGRTVQSLVNALS